jgi:dynamin 1-like protein
MLGDQPDKSNLPAVILPTIKTPMRAPEKQEAARVIMETRIIQNLIHSYYNIVKKNISDMIPKSIMAFLVNESRRIA